MDDPVKIVNVQGWIKVGATFDNGEWVGGTWVKMEDVGLSLSDSGILVGTPTETVVVMGKEMGDLG